LAVVLATSALACGSGEADAGEEERSAPPVEALAARSGALPLAIRSHGVVRAANQVEIRPEIAGRVVAVEVRSGDVVRRGQPLLRIDPEVLGQQLRQAEAGVTVAEAGVAAARATAAEVEARVVRTRSLAAAGIASQLDLETQEAQLAAAEARAGAAEAALRVALSALAEQRSLTGRATVRSPVDGRVGRIALEIGSRVDPDDVITTVGDPRRLTVEIPLAEAQLARVAVGRPVEIRAAVLGPDPLLADVARISPFLSSSSFSTVAEIDLVNPDERLAPGTFVTVDVLYGESAVATLVPTSALVEDPATGGAAVYRIDPSAMAEIAEIAELAELRDLGDEAVALTLRPVEVLSEGRGLLGVAGIDPGDWVVVVGQHLVAADGRGLARVRAADWERVAELQSLQREDVLNRFLEKQRRLARESRAEAGRGVFAGEGR
jgi:RND family efflux transporter MFP subunit